MTNPRELVERLRDGPVYEAWSDDGPTRILMQQAAAEITRLREREKVLCESNEHLSIAADVYLTELDNCTLNLRRLIAKFGYEDDNTTPKDCSEWIDARIAESAASSLLKRLEDATSTPSGQ